MNSILNATQCSSEDESFIYAFEPDIQRPVFLTQKEEIVELNYLEGIVGVIGSVT